MDKPYLPDEFKTVIDNVNSFFESRDTDPFTVLFGNGLYQQVANDLVKGTLSLMVWLVQPYDQLPPVDDSYAEDVKFDLFIASPTEASYTQKEREDINYHPRLKPVLLQIVEQLEQTEIFGYPDKVKWEKEQFIPFWSGGEPAAPSQPNLWKNNADCIKITGMQLKMNYTPACKAFTNFK